MGETYTEEGNLSKHFAKRIKAWGKKLWLEWVYIFIHTLYKVPKDWYLETEPRQGTSERISLTKSFIMIISFQSGFEFLDEVLQYIKEVIFETIKL